MSENNSTTVIKITERLGVHGWDHLDAVLLASLATESPLLLVGPHGTAKSLLVEVMANALNLPMRHYNAALINYDDLVGIPLPDESGTKLRFVTTPGTIWDAGFVFFDEISRCRADLSNKLFPIIHERRVVGIALDQLKHRWAAMNPPAPDDLNMDASSSYYIGSEPLDPALTDRFPFIVNVPNWGELSHDERLGLVSWKQNGHVGKFDLTEVVRAVYELIPAIEEEFDDWLGDYIICLIDLLEQAQLPQSPRRAAMLARNVVAIHAARVVLDGIDRFDVDEIDASAQIAVIYGMPQTATEVPPSAVKVIATHRQAWELAQYLEDDDWRQVFQETDDARRVALADHLGFSDEDMSKLITQSLGKESSDARQIGLAVAMFLSFRDRRNLDPSAFEPLAQLAYHILEPRFNSQNVVQNSPEATLWDEIRNWVETNREDTMLFRVKRNYLLNGFPDMWKQSKWNEALEQFHSDLMLFGVQEEVEENE